MYIPLLTGTHMYITYEQYLSSYMYVHLHTYLYSLQGFHVTGKKRFPLFGVGQVEYNPTRITVLLYVSPYLHTVQKKHIHETFRCNYAYGIEVRVQSTGGRWKGLSQTLQLPHR